MSPVKMQLRGCLIDYLNIYLLKRNRTSKTYKVIGGIEQEILKMHMDALNADLVPIPESSLKKKGEDLYFPCMRALSQNKVDFAVGCIPVHIDRLALGDPSHSYYNMDIRVVTKLPDPLSNLDVFIQPFTFNVWISILVCLLVVSMVSYLMYKKRFSLSEQIFSMFAELMQQGPELENLESSGGRLFYVFWSMSTLLLSLSYMSIILSFMMIPRRGPKIDNNEKLVKAIHEGKSNLIITTLYSSLIKIMEKSEYSSHRDLAHQVTTNKWMRDFRWYEVPKLIKNKNAVLLPVFIQKIFAPRGVIISKDSLYDGPLVVYYNKHFPYKEQFNKIILRACAAGLYDKLSQDSSFRLQIKIKKNVLDENSDVIKTLTAWDLQGAFLLFFIGVLVSFFALLLEIIVSKARMRNSARKTNNLFPL